MRQSPRRALLPFAVVAVAWLALDQFSKMAVASGGHYEGQVLSEPILGLFRLHLLHNTGGAWSILEGATGALGVFSVLVCIALSVYLGMNARRLSPVEAAGIGLIVAGGFGNAVDRFSLGYVIDFIEPTFIDFPVFNIADIGVTCGLVIFLIGLLLRERAVGRTGGDAS